LKELRALKNRSHGKVVGKLTISTPDGEAAPLPGMKVEFISLDRRPSEESTTDDSADSADSADRPARGRYRPMQLA
jgi:hypothetical protein